MGRATEPGALAFNSFFLLLGSGAIVAIVDGVRRRDGK
jgi:hypothetical protein